MLSEKLVNQIEKELLKDMSSMSQMFNLIGLKSLRKIKNEMIIADNTLLLRKDNEMNSIYIIQEGYVRVQDNGMSFVNEYKAGEILGLNCFQKLIETKQKIDVDKYFDSSNEDVNKNLHKNKHKNI